MKYANLPRLKRKLKARLNISDTDNNDSQNSLNELYPSEPLGITVDPDLVNDVIEEQENFLDLILGQIYVLPLVNSHPILADIITDLVISELMQVHFLGMGFGNINSGDISGTANNSKQDAYFKINMLTAGLNIFIPGVNPINYIPGMIPPRRTLLPGESLISVPMAKISVNNQTVVDKTTTNYQSYLNRGITNNPFSNEYVPND
jgi:hypothetical protein